MNFPSIDDERRTAPLVAPSDVVSAIADLAADFDVAGPGEIDLCLQLGIDPGRLSYGPPLRCEMTRSAGTVVLRPS